MTRFEKDKHGKTIAIQDEMCQKCKCWFADKYFRRFTNKNGNISWSKICMFCEGNK